MPGYPIRDVWGVACSKCHAPTGWRCQDLRTGVRRSLLGRRTHPERARELRRLKLDQRAPRRDMLWESPRRFEYLQPTATINFTAVGEQFRTFNERMITMATVASTTAATITAQYNQVWNGWVVGNTTTGTYATITDENMARFTGTGVIWDWTQPVQTFYGSQADVYDRWQVVHEREVPSPEELQRREDEAQRQREALARRQLEIQQEREQAEYERLLAHARGLELLDMILTPEQCEDRRTDGKIRVTGSDGGLWVVDILHGGVHGNVYEVDAHGCFLGRICVAPRMHVNGRSIPLSDGWVGQILSIQNNEAEFRRVGNWSGRRPCQHPDVPILERAA